jgi:hypothetical protein
VQLIAPRSVGHPPDNLQAASFQLNPVEKVGLVGPNGQPLTRFRDL